MTTTLPLDQSRVPSEMVFAEYLRQHHIPNVFGKQTTFAHYADIVAWGFILIEVKYSTAKWNYLHDSAEFRFSFTHRQKERLKADVIALMCQWDANRISYHFFPRDYPMFYQDGILRTVSTYQYGLPAWNKRGNFLTQAVMDEAQDRLDLIERARMEYASTLS